MWLTDDPDDNSKRGEVWRYAHSQGYRLYDGETDAEDIYQNYFARVVTRWRDDNDRVEWVLKNNGQRIKCGWRGVIDAINEASEDGS